MFGTMGRDERRQDLWSFPYCYSPPLLPKLLLEDSLLSLCLNPSCLVPSSQLNIESFPKHTTSIPKFEAASVCSNCSSRCFFPSVSPDTQILLSFSQNSSPASCLPHKALSIYPSTVESSILNSLST